MTNKQQQLKRLEVKHAPRQLASRVLQERATRFRERRTLLIAHVYNRFGTDPLVEELCTMAQTATMPADWNG